MGIFPARATPDRIPLPHQDRPRDMGRILRDTTDRGDPVDEVIHDGMMPTDLDADHYGKRTQRYEPQELILSNELVNLIGKIDRDRDELRARTDEVLRVHDDVKAVLQKYVIDLNVHMQRQMAVVAVCRDEITGMKARIVETLNAKPVAAAPRSNGNGSAYVSGDPSSEGVTTQEPVVEKDEPVVQPAAPNNRSKGK